MLRLALTYQLILAVAVGPLLCCCTGNLLASPPADTSHKRAPDEPTSCCSHKRGSVKTTPAKKQAPEKPVQPEKKCPCKDGAGKAGAIQSDSAQAPLSDFLRALALDSITPFDIPLAVEAITCCRDASDREGRPDGARRTASVLLYAHHNLRC